METLTLRKRIVARLAHYYPFYSGCGTFGNSVLIRKLAGKGSGLAWGTLWNGMKILVMLDDFNGRAVFYVGDVDRKITWILRKIIRQHDNVIDVGANIGLVTLTMSQLIGDSGKVWSFEPNPNLIEMLKESLEKKQCQKCQTPSGCSR